MQSLRKKLSQFDGLIWSPTFFPASAIFHSPLIMTVQFVDNTGDVQIVTERSYKMCCKRETLIRYRCHQLCNYGVSLNFIPVPLLVIKYVNDFRSSCKNIMPFFLADFANCVSVSLRGKSLTLQFRIY